MHEKKNQHKEGEIMLVVGKYTNSYLQHMGLNEKHYLYRYTPWDEDCDETCFDSDDSEAYHTLSEALEDVATRATAIRNNPKAHDVIDQLEFLTVLCDGIYAISREE